MANDRESNKQIQIGAVISYISIAFNIIAGLLYTPWLVRQIGQADYGLYSLAISLIGFFALDFGLGAAVSRFLSMYKAREDEEGAKRFLGITFKLFFVIGTFIFFALLVIYQLIGNIYLELTPQEIAKLRVVFLIAGLYTSISFPFRPFDGILIAGEKFFFIKFLALLHKALIIIFMVMALLSGGGLYSLVIVNAAVGLLKVLIQYIFIRKKTLVRVDWKSRDRKVAREIAGFSIWTTVISVAQRFILNITPTVLGALSGSIQIAVFSVGMTIEGYTWTISHALGGLFLPKVTRMAQKNGGIEEIEALSVKVGRIQLLIVGLVLSGFASLGSEFMRLWMGQSFSDSFFVALLLIMPGFITLTQEIAYTALVALNHIKYRAYAALLTACVSVVLSIILSRGYGAIGSAIAIFIGNIVGFVIFINIVYVRILKLDILRFLKETHLSMLAPILLATAFGLILQIIFPTQSLIIFAIKAVAFAGIYFFLMWTISMNLFEKELIRGFVKGRALK